MTSSDYFVGQVADFLSRGKKKQNDVEADKLASLFDCKPKITPSSAESKKTPQAKKKQKHKSPLIKSDISGSKTKRKVPSQTLSVDDVKVKSKQVKHKELVKNSPEKSIKPKHKRVNNSQTKEHKKKDKENVIQKEPKKKKTKKNVIEDKVQEDDDSKQVSRSAGFCPPEGIVHETLQKKQPENAVKQKSKKRKVEEVTSDDEEENTAVKKRTKHKRDKTKDRRTVFVGNLPLDAKKSTVKTLFREFGKIESLRFRCPPPADLKTPKRVAVIKKEFHPERSNIVSFVCFEDQAAAKKALQLNGHNMDGFHLRIDLASNNKKHNKTNSVFIGNLAYDMEENGVWDHFEPCGSIENVRIVRDRKTGLGKGFGYVLFQDKSSVDLALKLNDSKLKGRKIRVTTCHDVPKKVDHKNHPARQRLLKKAKKMGIKPTNFRPGQKQKPKSFKKKSKKTTSDPVEKAFAPSFTSKASTTSGFKSKPSFSSSSGPSKNKHIKFN